MPAALSEIFSLTADAEGSVWVFGTVLGKTYKVPTRMKQFKDIVEISCGFTHFLAADSRGDVFSCGQNRHGNLGRDEGSPYHIPELKNIIFTACGVDFSICVDSCGQVWGFGNNSENQLGDKHQIGEEVTCPIQIPLSSNILAASCGADYTIFLDTNGKLFGLGDNVKGQLGLPELQNYPEPTAIPIPAVIRTISCGYRHTLALDEEGNVWGFGKATTGQLGSLVPKRSFPRIHFAVPSKIMLPPSFSFPVLQICASQIASHFVDSKGDYWVCGYNASSCLGLDGGHLYSPTKHNVENVVYMPRSTLSCHMLVVDDEMCIWRFGQAAHNARLGRLPTDDNEEKLPNQYLSILGINTIWKVTKSARK